MPDKKIISLDELSRFKTNCDSEYQETLVNGTNIKTINNTSLLGSGDYEFDSALSEISTNAVQNKVVSKEFAEVNYELAIIREELFETILTEIDYQENFAISYTIPDTLTDTDGTHRVVFSETQLKTIEFNSVVMNQLVQNGNFASASGWLTTRGTISVSNNVGTLTCNENGNALIYRNDYSYVAGKNLVAALMRATSGKTLYISGSSSSPTFVATGNWQLCAYIETGRTGGYPRFGLSNASIGDTVEISNVQIIDLTQMFGAGNEPTTLTDIRIQWLLSLGYIAHNTGSLLSTTATGIDLIGQNQWDEEWELGIIDVTTGQNAPTNENIRSKNYIKVIPNTTYYHTKRLQMFFYDEDKNYLQSKTINAYAGTFTTPSNASFMRFRTVSYGGTYNHNICINLSNANINGTYKPYEKHTISVPQTSGMSAGNVHDYIEVVEGNIVEGEQLYNLVFHSVIDSMDLGGPDWTRVVENNIGFFRTNVGVPTNLGNFSQILSTLYTLNNGTNWKQLSNMQIIANGSANIYIRNDRYTDAAAFKSAMSGQVIFYEKAVSTETIIATDLQFDQISSLIQQGGTINALFTNVPPNVTTTFVVKKAVGE